MDTIGFFTTTIDRFAFILSPLSYVRSAATPFPIRSCFPLVHPLQPKYSFVFVFGADG